MVHPGPPPLPQEPAVLEGEPDALKPGNDVPRWAQSRGLLNPISCLPEHLIQFLPNEHSRIGSGISISHIRSFTLHNDSMK